MRQWLDPNTAIFYAGLEEAVRENLDEAFGAHFLVTLKFDAQGNWKIVKAHRMSEKEVEKRERRENEISFRSAVPNRWLSRSFVLHVLPHRSRLSEESASLYSISPDKKWEYSVGIHRNSLKSLRAETVIDFFEQRNPGTAPAGQDPELLWAPDSKRFGFNYRQSDARASYDVSVDRFLSATWR